MNTQQFTPGQPVWWSDRQRKGYGAFGPVKAIFVAYTENMVTIDAILANGGTRRKHVPVKSLTPREVTQ